MCAVTSPGSGGPGSVGGWPAVEFRRPNVFRLLEVPRTRELFNAIIRAVKLSGPMLQARYGFVLTYHEFYDEGTCEDVMAVFAPVWYHAAFAQSVAEMCGAPGLVAAPVVESGDGEEGQP